MRPLLLLIMLCGLALPAAATADSVQALQRDLAGQMHRAGAASGALAIDVSARRTLYGSRSTTGRLPASVEKLWTTSAVLTRFGARAVLRTRVFGSGRLDSHGTWHGDLYLRGGGDPTFGHRSFARSAYGSGGSVEDLASAVRRAGITAITGLVVGDESAFDTRRGTAPSGYRPSIDIGGPLSALSFDRGLTEGGGAFQSNPASYAAAQLVHALRAAHVTVPSGHVASGRTPASTRSRPSLASASSPSVARLIRLTNVPSDNLFAELLLKGLGARFGGAGTTGRGAGVASKQADGLGLHPTVLDGSGLSRGDRTSPSQMVGLLRRYASNRTFTDSLAVAGRSGTLENRMGGTSAAGRCRGKTGTLHDASNLVGYCRTRNDHLVVFAWLMNFIDPSRAHTLQDRMTEALARYRAAGAVTKQAPAPAPADPPPASGGAPAHP
ncbi:MAG: D-alanyl-D-alanine carboxypeptidase/D-alanyl-D-alanine-endopeptidase [Solirubrobacteraceae bacterium]